MQITRIEAWPYRLGFRDGPYAMSHVVLSALSHRVFRIETADGVKGVGEYVVPPSADEAECQSILAAEPEISTSLTGKPVDAVFEAAAGLREQGKAARGFAFGLETAAFDLVSRRAGVSLVEMLGGAQGQTVPDYFSISEKTEDAIRDRVALAGPERAVIQLKIGIGGLDKDLSHTRAALAAMGPDQILLADFNGGRSVSDVIELAAEIKDPRLVWEEPCASYDDNAAVARAIETPVMIDQSVADIGILRRAVSDGLAHSLCIKPAFLGGLSVAREARDLCAEAGVAMRIDGPWCGDIATAAIASLAIGAPPGLLVSGCDLREPLVISPNLGGLTNDGSGRFKPPVGLGIGIDPAALDLLGPPDKVYL